MKPISLAIVLALGLLFVGHAAEAQRAAPQGFHGEKFQANKKFGLGLELGEPTSINGKLFLSPDTALDFGIGELYHGYYVTCAGCGDVTGLHVYADYLWHPFVIAKSDAFYLPFYVGVGGRVWNADYGCDRNGNCYNLRLFGVRVPVGLSFDFNNVPLDIFAQIVPTLDFYDNVNGPYSNHSIFLDFDLSIGIRFWFT